MGLPLRDTKLHTYAEYCTWPEDARHELIDGIAYAMAPAPVRSHQGVLGGIFSQVHTALEGHRCRAYIAPFDVRLPHGDERDDDVDTVVQPDLSVICDRDKLDTRGCRGAPDWIVEVLSPATASHDMIAKRRLYERAGVREYWLVHPTDRVVTVYTLNGSAYGAPAIHELKDRLTVTVLPGIEIDWTRVLADVD